MFGIFVRGFALGASLIIAIGPQNAFVIRQGLLKNHIFAVICVCLLCDIVVMGISVYGIGAMLQKNKLIHLVIGVIGILFFLFYAFLSFKNAIAPKTKNLNLHHAQFTLTLKKTILATFALTLLNPNFYLDTFVIIGGVAATLGAVEKSLFLLGLLSVSFLWYFGIGYGVRILLPLFQSRYAFRILDCVTGMIMCFVAYYLFEFVMELNTHF